MLTANKRVAIIGGGISGLSAAFALEEKRRADVPVEYVLYESSPRLGGVLVTDRVEGCLVEAGPDSFISEKPWAADLCKKIGLGDRLLQPTLGAQMRLVANYPTFVWLDSIDAVNGTNGYVDFGNAANLQLSSGDFTAMAWVNFNSLGVGVVDMSIID